MPTSLMDLLDFNIVSRGKWKGYGNDSKQKLEQTLSEASVSELKDGVRMYRQMNQFSDLTYLLLLAVIAIVAGLFMNSIYNSHQASTQTYLDELHFAFVKICEQNNDTYVTRDYTGNGQNVVICKNSMIVLSK